MGFILVSTSGSLESLSGKFQRGNKRRENSTRWRTFIFRFFQFHLHWELLDNWLAKCRVLVRERIERKIIGFEHREKQSKLNLSLQKTLGELISKMLHFFFFLKKDREPPENSGPPTKCCIMERERLTILIGEMGNLCFSLKKTCWGKFCKMLCYTERRRERIISALKAGKTAYVSCREKKGKVR